MSPRELLVELREKGVEVKANGDRLVIDAPRGAITPDLRDALSANKAELLQILTAPPIEKAAARPAPVLVKEPVAVAEPGPEPEVKREAPRSPEPQAISPERSSVL